MKTILNTLALGFVLAVTPAFAQDNAPAAPAVAPVTTTPSAPATPSKKEKKMKWKQAKKDCLQENSALKGKALKACVKSKVQGQ